MSQLWILPHREAVATGRSGREWRLRTVTLVVSVTSKRIPIRTSPDRRHRSHVVYRLSDRCRPQATPAVRADFFRVDFLRTPTEKGVADLTCWASTRGNAKPESRCAVRRSWCCSPSSCARPPGGRACGARPARRAPPVVGGRAAVGRAERVPLTGARRLLARISHPCALRPNAARRGSRGHGIRTACLRRCGWPGCGLGHPAEPVARPAQLVPHPAHRQLGQARHRAPARSRRLQQPVLRGRPPGRRRGVHRQRGRRHHEEQHVPALRAARDERRRDGVVVQPHRHAHPERAAGRHRAARGRSPSWSRRRSTTPRATSWRCGSRTSG